MKITCLLTQYKRNHLRDQLESVYNQTLKPEQVIVFQNENHVDIQDLKKQYDFIHVQSDYNTKHFGRFTFCLNFSYDYCIVMDDDILPGAKCFESYVRQAEETNGIIGGIGRFLDTSDKNHTAKMSDVGKRNLTEVVWCCHLWLFRKKHLHNMFSIEPYTWDTGEDMHLCFTNKVRDNVPCYAAEQLTQEESSDIRNNQWSDDEFASFRTSSHRPLRNNIQKHFIEKYNLRSV